MRDTVVINIRLTKELTENLDTLIKKKIFSSRAEAIREFLREYIKENTTTTRTSPHKKKTIEAPL